jgi:hypothetical protein
MSGLLMVKRCCRIVRRLVSGGERFEEEDMETKDDAEKVSSELSEQALSEVAGGGAPVPTYSDTGGACAGKVDVSAIRVSSSVDQASPSLLNEAVPPTKSKVVSGLT